MREDKKRRRNSNGRPVHTRTTEKSKAGRQGQRPLSDEEIERRRRARAARRKREAQRRRRKVLAGMIACCIVVILLAVVGISAVVKSHNKKVKQAKQQEEKQVETVQKEDSAALAKAELMAQQYDYDGAIELLKNEPDASSNDKIQSAISEYEKIGIKPMFLAIGKVED